MDKMYGLSEYIDVQVPPNTEIEVKSSVGEWIIGSLLRGKEQHDLWKSHGLQFDARMAKFRNTPCIMGNYTWNFSDEDFDLVYENGVVTWSYKHEQKEIKTQSELDMDQVD